MKVALEIGTIDIRDKELARFIQSTNIDEIKSMIVDLLKKQIHSKKVPDKTGKWGAFAERMSGLTTPEITEKIHETRTQMRDGFALRDFASGGENIR